MISSFQIFVIYETYDLIMHSFDELSKPFSML